MSDSGRARYGHLAHSSARPSKSRRRQLRELPFEAFALTVDLTAAELRFELADASPLTYVSYERVIRLHISKQLGSIQLQQLRGARIERFYRELLTGGLKPTTVRTVRAILSKALSDATEERWGPMLARNPARGIEAPKGEARRFTTWSKREARMFEEHVRTDRLYALWVLALTTGARRGELLGLTWRDSDLEAGRIAIAQQVRPDRKGGPVIAEPKTKKSARSITLDADTLRALRAHRDAQELERAVFGSDYADSDLVFCREDGRLLEPSRISERFAKLAEDAGLPKIRLHDLRHTAATLLLAAGKPAKVVSERLGHSGTAITQDLYQHVTPEFELDAATAGAAVFGDG